VIRFMRYASIARASRAALDGSRPVSASRWTRSSGSSSEIFTMPVRATACGHASRLTEIVVPRRSGECRPWERAGRVQTAKRRALRGKPGRDQALPENVETGATHGVRLRRGSLHTEQRAHDGGQASFLERRDRQRFCEGYGRYARVFRVDL
jgi:hypothetical protein